MISSHARYQAMRPRQCFGVQPFGYEHDGDVGRIGASDMWCAAIKSHSSVADFTATVA